MVKSRKDNEMPDISNYDVVPMEEKYSDVYDLMILPEYDKFFYNGDMKEFHYKKDMFNRGLTPEYSGTGAVALYKGKPVAFCIGVTTRHFIVTATDPEHTGKGLGTLLLELTLRKYHLSGVLTARASTKKFNTPMQSILEKFGKRIKEQRSEGSYMYELDTYTSRDLTQYEECIAGMNVPK